MVRVSKQIADKHNMQSFIPVLKTWTSVKYFVKEVNEGVREKYTIEDLIESTGLNRKMIDKCQNYLKEEEIYRTEIKYKGPLTRSGQVAILNDFYEENQEING